MKYYSETLKKLYDTEEALNSAENKQKKLDEEKRIKREAEEAERKKKNEEKSARWKEVEEASNHADELFKKFCEDYGEYRHGPTGTWALIDLLNNLF